MIQFCPNCGKRLSQSGGVKFCKDNINCEGKYFILETKRPNHINKAEEMKEITGFDTIQEHQAYDKGREHEQIVLKAFIKRWDGSTNSELGQLLSDKAKEINGK